MVEGVDRTCAENGFDWTLNLLWCSWTDSRLEAYVNEAETGSEPIIPGTTTNLAGE